MAGLSRQLTSGIIGVGLAVVLATFSGIVIGTRGIGHFEIISLALAVSAVVILLFGERGITVGYTIAILAFALGYRAIYITPRLTVHPLTLLIALLFIMLLMNRHALRQINEQVPIPKVMWALMIFAGWGLVIGYLGNIPVDIMFNSFLNFVLILPIYCLSAHVILKNAGNGFSVAEPFVVVGTYISIFGILEFVFPEIQALFPDFIATTARSIDMMGFERAPFAFFGHPVATFISFLALPFFIPLYSKYSRLISRSGLSIALLLNLIAVYLGGFRSIWVGTIALFIVLAIIRRSTRHLIIVLFALLLTSIVVPETAISRFDTLLGVLTGTPLESSAIVRMERGVDAWARLASHPIGSGWGTSSWSHIDFLSIAVDLGLIPGVVFILWYVLSLFGMIRVYKATSDPRDLALSGGMFASGVLLATQPIIVLSQLIIPVWFLWGLAQVRIQGSRD